MGGKIWVASDVARGTQFHFTALMGIADANAIGVGSIAPPEILRGLKVLVVDDSRTNRRILEGMLRRWDMKPTSVEGGEEALTQLSTARATAEPYALILTDMHMPMMDGFSLVERIRIAIAPVDGQLGNNPFDFVRRAAGYRVKLDSPDGGKSFDSQGSYSNSLRVLAMSLRRSSMRSKTELGSNFPPLPFFPAGFPVRISMPCSTLATGQT